MKKIITAILICISCAATAQTTKEDSLKVIEQNKIVEKIVTTTNIKEFQQWLYENVTAKEFNNVSQYYNAFIRQKYSQLVANKSNEKK